MKFKCHKCSNEIIIKYISPGDAAECKHCKALNIVPLKGEEQGLIVHKDSDAKIEREMSELEKQKLFDRLWTIAMSFASYGAFIIYLMARVKSIEGSFFLKDIILSKSFGIIFGVFGILLSIIAIGIIEIILINKTTEKLSFFNSLDPFMKYMNIKQNIPLLIVIIIIAICELVILIIN